MDVSVRATVEGFSEGARQVEGFNKAIEGTGTAAAKSSKETAEAAKITQMLGGKAVEAAEGLSGLQLAGATAGAALGGALVFGAKLAWDKLSEGIETVRELGDKFNNLSQQTGVAVEKLSGGMRLAAETTGSSVEGLAHGMNQLNKAIAGAADGTGKQAEAFKRLGIEVHDVQGNLKSADQVLDEIATAFAGAEDGAVKAEIAMTLLGRAGVNLIPLLNQGAAGLERLEKEAKLAGITMDKETAEAASKLNENMRVLKAYGEGFWMEVASPIVDGLAKITTAMRDARREGEGFFSSMVQGARTMWEALFMPSTKTLINDKGVEIAGWIAVIKQQEELVRQGDTSSLTASTLKNAYAALQAAYAEQGRLEQQEYVYGGGFGANLAGPKNQLSAPGKPDKPGKAGSAGREQTNSQIVSEYLSYYENMVRAGEMTRDEQLALLDEMAEEFKNYEDERVRIAAAAAGIRKKTADEEAAHEKRLRTMLNAEEIRLNAEGDKELKKMHDAQDAARDKQVQVEIKQINETTFLFKEQKLAALQELIDKYTELGPEGAKALTRIRGEMEALKGSTRATGVVIQDVGFDMGKVWQNVHTGLTQGIGDIARYALGISSSVKSLGDALKGFLMSIANSIIDMFAKVAANNIFEWIFGGSSGGGGGGFFSSLFGGGGGSGSGGGGGGMGLINGASSIKNLFSGDSLIGKAYNSLFGGNSFSGWSVGAGAGEGAVGWGAGAFDGWAIGAGAGEGAVGAGALSGGFAGMAPFLGPAAILAFAALAFNDGPDDNIFTQYAADPVGFMNSSFVKQNGWTTFDEVVAGVTKNNDEWNASYSASFAGGMATGGDFIATRPTRISIAEAGAERITVSPLAGSAHGNLRGAGGLSVNMYGPNMLDNYGMQRLARELKKMMSGG